MSNYKIFSMAKTGIILVRTTYHNLFCNIFNVKYDRIGFICEDFLWLYWNIPTINEPYIGLYDKFNTDNCHIMYAPITEKVDFDKFIQLVKKSKYHIIPLDQQIESCAYGINTINSVFKELGVTKIPIGCVSIQYEFFYPPKLYEKGKEVENKITPCLDLLYLVMNEPLLCQNQESYKEKYSKLTSLFSDFLKDLMSGIINTSTINNISHLTKFRANEKLDDIIINQKLFLTEDTKIRSTMNQFRSTIYKMVNRSDQYVDLNNFISLCNEILYVFNMKPIEKKKKSQSIIIATDNEETDIPLSIEDNTLNIPLSGEGIEKLNQENLIYLLQCMDGLDNNNCQFDELRSIITSKLYNKKS